MLKTSMTSPTTEIATLAAGCFWCVEAVFERLQGVTSVVSGYSGGAMANPSYEKVSMGQSGHAEVIQVTFDPTLISYEKILEVFWEAHDSTTLNRQGNDVGSQYRSAIFFHSPEQKDKAEKSLQQAQTNIQSPIVTEITPFENFYPAEKDHQNFYNNNKEHPYCQIVIEPKLKKMSEEFKENLKET